MVLKIFCYHVIIFFFVTVFNYFFLIEKNYRNTKIDNNDKLEVGNELFIKAGSKITLTVGKSTITMDQMSIKIESPNIEINAEMQFKSNSKMLSQHEAGATMIINGKIVKIN